MFRVTHDVNPLLKVKSSCTAPHGSDAALCDVRNKYLNLFTPHDSTPKFRNVSFARNRRCCAFKKRKHWGQL